MLLPKDVLSATYTKPNLYLCETDKTKICKLDTTDTVASLKFNSYSELSFSIGRTYEDLITGETKVNPFYNKIEALRLVHLDNFGYFEIQEPELFSDGIQEIKNVTAFSLEYTLSQKYLDSFYINTGEVNSVEVIYAEDNEKSLVPVTLYNIATPELSLLHLILEKVYGWTIGHVDLPLRTMSRTFEVERCSVYDFIMQDICDKFNCFVVFDTENNTINFYAEALVTKFIGDGSSKSFIISPAYDSVSSVSIDSYRTTAYKYDASTGVITFKEAPANGAKIQVTDGSQSQWMTDVFVRFDNLAQEVNVSYSAEDIKTVLTVKGADDLDIREVNFGLPYITDLSYYYNVDWMGKDLFDAYTLYLQKCDDAHTQYTENSKKMIELNNYIDYETNRFSLQYSIADHVSSTTVGKYYVRGGVAPNYYYKEVQLPDEYNANVEHYYTLSGNDLTEQKVEDLYSAIQTYYMSKTDKDVTEIDKLKDSFAFMETNTIAALSSTLKSANDTTSKDNAVLSFFDEMWEQIGLTPLKTLYQEPYKKVKETNVESGWDKESSPNYWMYYPVNLILRSIDKAILLRENVIEEYNEEYSALQTENNNTSTSLLVSNNFTEKQLIRLSAFLREDEYTDSNFVETDSDTIDSLMQTKQELLECGKIELAKLCEPKLEFSMTMANIYALHEFEPIIDQFQLGKLINVVIRDDYIKRARLLQIDINFDDLSDFSCEFGELTGLKTPSSIHADLLASAMSAGQSVASNASYWNKGSDTAFSTDLKIQEGLLGTTDVIKAIDGTQGVSIDKYGIHLQLIDPDTGEIDPKEGWIVNNQFLYSDDNFKTTKSVFGEYKIGNQAYWGLLAEAVIAGYIEGSTIVGGTIDIGNGTFVVESDGSVTMKASSIDGYVEENGVISSINQSPESIVVNANRISLAGKNIDLTSDNITIDSTNFSVDKDGKITATSGEIAGWTIYPGLFRKETTIDGMDYQIYMQSTDGVSTSNAFAVRKKKSTDSSWDYQFSVNYEGRLMAKNADITGSITAEDGSIAGFNIGPGGSYSNALYKRVSGDVSDYEVGLKASSGETDLAFYVKETTDDWKTSDNTFYVRNNGQLYAQNAVITGEVNASSGKIGGWNIGDMGGYTGSMYSTCCAASTPSESNPEYAVMMRGNGSSPSNIAIAVKKRTSSATSWVDAEETFYVLKSGRVKMSDADVTGKINASSGSITGNLNISGGLINTQGDYTVTLRGVQSDVGKGVFYITDNSSGSAEYPVRINGDGSARFTNVTITGNSTIAAACIPDLNANKITSGTISTSILDASVITTGNFSSKSLSTGKLSVTYGGNIGIWTVNSNNYLYAISGDYGVSLSATSVSHGQGGSATWVNIVKAGQNASDERLKKNIVDLDDCLDNVFDNLKPVQFEYSKELLGQGTHFGYIAQDVIKSFEDEGKNINDYSFIYETEIEDNSEDKYYQLNKTDFIALNTWQIQKLKARVEELEKKLEALEG